MSKLVQITVLSIFLFGCVVAPVPTGKYTSDLPPKEIATQTYNMALECWAKEWGLFSDGVNVKNVIELRGIVITARRTAPDLPYLEPFMIVIVNEENGRTVIETQEGEFTLGYKTGFSADVGRWIRGDLFCSD